MLTIIDTTGNIFLDYGGPKMKLLTKRGESNIVGFFFSNEALYVITN